jgi:hypothetical protein
MDRFTANIIVRHVFQGKNSMRYLIAFMFLFTLGVACATPGEKSHCRREYDVNDDGKVVHVCDNTEPAPLRGNRR